MVTYKEYIRRKLNAQDRRKINLNNVAPFCNYCAIGQLRKKAREYIKEHS